MAQTTFNRVFNHTEFGVWPNYAGGSGRNVVEVATGYLVLGHHVDSTSRTRALSYLFDPDGNFITSTWTNPTSPSHQNVGYADVAFDDEFGSLSAVFSFDGVNDSTSQVELTRFDQAGGLVWQQMVLDSCGCGVRQTRLDEQGRAIMVGYNVFDAMVFRADTAGAVQWMTSIPDSWDALSVEPLDGSGYCVAGYEAGGVDNGLWVVRMDSLGNILWKRNFGGSKHAYDNVSAIQTQDGSIVATGSYMPLPGSWNSPQWNYFRKWDINGNVQWSKQYNQAPECTTYDLEELPSGELVACGNEQSHWGLLIKLEEDGDLLWLRRYVYYQTNGSIHIPYDVEPTSDGGFVLTGQARQGPFDSVPGLQMVWLLKVDSAGCLVPGCGNIGVEEVALGLEDALSVYPNPATDQVQVSLHLPQDLAVRGALQLVLVDAVGRTVLELPVGNDRTLRLDLSGIAAGVNYLHLRDESRWLSGTKLVVE